MKHKILAGLGWLVSLIFLAYAIKDLNWKTALDAVLSISPITPVIMVGVYCTGFILRAWRWKLFLPYKIPLGTSLAAIVIGYAANNILPARLGEIVRAQAIGQKCQISRSLALATILVERIFDGLVLVGFLYWGIRGNDVPAWALSTARLGLALFGTALVSLLIFSATLPIWKNKINAIPMLKMRTVLQQFANGIALVGRKPSLPLTMVGLTATIWFVEAYMYYLAIRAFDLQVPLTASLFVMGLVNLGILLPSAPGYIGAFQYFGVLALSAWEVSSEAALACIVMIHTCQYLSITVWGISYIPFFGFSSFRKLNQGVGQATTERNV